LHTLIIEGLGVVFNSTPVGNVLCFADETGFMEL
jgi:hypothetical protein